jgi:hypothetical protein
MGGGGGAFSPETNALANPGNLTPKFIVIVSGRRCTVIVDP